jgi:hypothetical protein
MRSKCIVCDTDVWENSSACTQELERKSTISDSIIYAHQYDQWSKSCLAQKRLGLIAVRMTSGAIVVKDGVTYFAIDVYPDDTSRSWRVFRRYNDFILLALKLGIYDLPDAPFPRKHLGACAGVKLERRCERFENWLSQAMLFLAERRMCTTYLREFLEDPAAHLLKQLLLQLPMHSKLPAFIVAATMSVEIWSTP